MSGTEACLFLDNFTLLHHGKKQSGLTYAEVISGDILVDVYSVAGTRVRGGVTASGATAGLAPGIYILRTGSSARKVAVR